MSFQRVGKGAFYMVSELILNSRKCEITEISSTTREITLFRRWKWLIYAVFEPLMEFRMEMWLLCKING